MVDCAKCRAALMPEALAALVRESLGAAPPDAGLAARVKDLESSRAAGRELDGRIWRTLDDRLKALEGVKAPPDVPPHKPPAPLPDAPTVYGKLRGY